ncbi:MAG: MBL fold metallo-hydrolase [Clostridiales bacterium]|nr:MBL fold metallo-hydrolase [Clostridiales bacterium]
MTSKKSRSKKSLNKKQILLISLVAVLIVATLVILTTDNALNNYLVEYLSKITGESKETVKNTEDGKLNPSILSGKGNITLPDNFDLQNLLEVHFLDVGQGDAIIINLPDYKTMLIDSGTSTKGLADIRDRYLQYLSDVTSSSVIEYMIITHSDADHYNMLGHVVDSYHIKSAYYNKYVGKAYSQFLAALKAEKGIELREVYDQSVIYTITGKGYDMTIYCSGNSAFSGANQKNNQSFICLLEYGGRRVLFTGDAGVATEKWFISEIDKPYIDVDVLKVGHHGSNSSTGQEFLEFIDTEYAIISCDDGTMYGHPHKEAMDRLAYYSIVTYCTDIHGNILLYMDGDGDFGFLTQNNADAQNNSLGIDQRKISIS